MKTPVYRVSCIEYRDIKYITESPPSARQAWSPATLFRPGYIDREPSAAMPRKKPIDWYQMNVCNSSSGSTSSHFWKKKGDILRHYGGRT